jgi:hypothetical protein
MDLLRSIPSQFGKVQRSASELNLQSRTVFVGGSQSRAQNARCWFGTAAAIDFRYNNRSGLGIEDIERVERALKGIEGKRSQQGFDGLCII